MALLATLLISAVLASSLFTVSENDDDAPIAAGLVDGDLTYTQIGTTMNASVALTPGATPMAVTIQDTIELDDLNTYTVTLIAAGGFRDCTTLKTVVLPANLTKIDTNAFRGSGLTSVNMPSSVTVIANNAFYECADLVSVNNMPAGLALIDTNAFRFCRNLTTIDLSKVSTISGTAFEYCTSLTSVDLSAATDIGIAAFRFCTGIESVVLSTGLTTINAATFNGCTSLKTINLDTVEILGLNAFRSCTSLVGHLDMSSVTDIGETAFRGGRMSSIDISSVVTIGPEAFNLCANLESVTIPASTIFIAEAFANCSSLVFFDVDPANPEYCSDDDILFNKQKTFLHTYPPAKVGATYTVSKDVTRIADRAFLGCKNLEAINVEAGNLDYVSVDGVVYTIDMETIVVYPIAKKGASYTVPDGVKTIGPSAFRQNTYLTEIILPYSITDVGDRAFTDCAGLESLNLSNVQTLGVSVFFGCSNLKLITLPDGVDTTDTDVPAGTLKIFVNGDYVTVSATLDGTVVTLNIVTPDGFAVLSTKVGTSSDKDDIRGSSASWTFDAGQHKDVYVTLTTGPGYTILMPPTTGGHYEYRVQGEDIWRDVVNGKVYVPNGWAVELRGVPDEGYEFQWDNAIHRDAADPTGKLKISPTSSGTITGTFSLIEEDEDEDDEVSYFAILILLVVFAVLLLLILFGGIFEKRS